MTVKKTELPEQKIDMPATRPGQSPEAKKAADAFLEYTEDSTIAEVQKAQVQVDALHRATEGQKEVEGDVTADKTKKELSWLNRGLNKLERIGGGTAEAIGKAVKVDVSRSAKIATGVGIVGLGGWLGYKAYKRRTGDTSEKKEGLVADLKSGIWGLVKKVALRGGAALAASYVASYFLKGRSLQDLRDDFLNRIGIQKKEKAPGQGTSTDAGSGSAVENAEQGLQKENQKIQKKYNLLGSAINNFYTTTKGNGGARLGNENMQKLDQAPGTIPYMLNARYKTLGDFVGESGIFDTILSKGRGEMVDRFQKSFLDTPLEVVQSFVNNIAGSLDKATFNLISIQTTVSGIFDALKSDPNYNTIVTYAFDKTMMTLAYLKNRKDAVRKKFESEGLSGSALDDKMNEIFNSQKMYTFDTNGNSTGGFIDYLEKNNLLQIQAEDIDDELKKKTEASNQEKGGKLESIDTLEDKVNKTTITDQEVQEFCGDMLDEVNFFANEGIEHSMLPVASGLLNPSAEFKKVLYENSPLKLYADQFAKDLQIIHNKGKNITTDDIKKLREMTEKFYEMREQFYTSERYAQEAKDENGKRYLDIGLRLKGAYRTTKDTILYSYRVLTDSNSSIFEKGEAGLAVTGLLYTGYKFRGMATLRPLQAVKGFGKGMLRMGVDGAKITKRGVSKFGRQLKNHLPNFLAASYYNTENKLILLKDLMSGKLSGSQAVDIANRISGLGKSQQIGNVEGLFKYYFANIEMTDDQIKFLANNIETIQNNKSLRNKLFKSGGWLGNGRDILKPGNRKPFNADMSHLVPQLDELKKFESIAGSIDTLTGDTQKVAQSLLRNTRSLDETQKILTLLRQPQQAGFTTQRSLGYMIDDLITKGMKAEDIGQLLAKHSTILSNETEVRKFFSLMTEGLQTGKIPNPTTFAHNVMRNWKSYTNKSAQDILGMTDEMEKLNQPRGIAKAVASLKDLKNKLLPYRFRSPAIAGQLGPIDDAVTVLSNPQTVQAMNTIGPELATTTITNDAKLALKFLSTSLKDPKFAKALSNANSIDKVKTLISQKGITNISDEVLQLIAETKNGKFLTGNRILDKIHYMAHVDELNSFWKLMNNPTTKVVGRVLGKIVVVGGVGMGIAKRFSSNQEATKLEQDNARLADITRQEGLVGGLGFGVGGSLLGSGLILSWTPAGWVMMGAGVAIVAGEQLYNQYISSEKAWAYNKSQFINNGEGVTDNFILENISNSGLATSKLGEEFAKKESGSIDHALIAQTSDGVDAKILLSLYKLYPDALMNVEPGQNDDETKKKASDHNMSITDFRKKVYEEKVIVGELYERAKENIKTRAGMVNGTSNEGITQKNTTKEYHLIHTLAQGQKDPLKIMELINKEVGYAIMIAQASKESPNSDFSSYERIQALVAQESDIKNANTKCFDTMENLYEHHPHQFITIAMSVDKSGSDANHQRLIDYLRRKQAKTGVSLEIMMRKHAYRKDAISCCNVSEFLTTGNALQTMKFTAEDFKSADKLSCQGVLISDDIITEKYHISENPIDTIMYRYATEVLGIANFELTKDPYTNDQRFEKYFPESKKQYNGIYRENGMRRYNYNTTYKSEGIFSDWMNPLDNDGTITDIQSLITGLDNYYKQIFTSDKADTDESAVDTYKSETLKKIAYEEKRYKDNQLKIKNEMIAYIKEQNLKKDEYIALPQILIIKAARANIWGAGNYVYSYDNKVKKMDVKGTVFEGGFDIKKKQGVPTTKSPAVENEQKNKITEQEKAYYIANSGPKY